MTVGLIQFVATNVFNGGKTQVQSNSLLQGAGNTPMGDYPFINVMKTMQPWTYVNTGFVVTPSDLDSNGYPTVINNGGATAILFIPPITTKPGVWVLTWDGHGAVSVAPVGSFNTGYTSANFNNTAGGVGRCEFFPSGSYITVSINGIASGVDYPHNMQLFYKSEETALNNGQVFSTDFINLLKNARVGVFRDLAWNDGFDSGNAKAASTWSTRKPISYYSYYAYESRPTLYGGTATNAGSNVYTTSVFPTIHSSDGTAWTSGGPKDKDTIILLISGDSTSPNFTLNVNGSGAINTVYYQQDGSTFYNIANGHIMTLVYDAALNTWFRWGGHSGHSEGLENGYPPELLLTLCQQVKCHPYFMLSAFMVDPLSDWVTSLDAYVQANGPAWMVPRYELPNESWNFAYPNRYSISKANLYWGDGSTHNGHNHWAGWAASNISASVSALRGGDKTKYNVLQGVQSSQYASASFYTARVSSARSNSHVSVTFSAPSNIVATGNTLNVGDKITFDTVNAGDNLPSGLAFDTVYFVKTSGSTITVSATNGGTTLTFGTPTGNPASLFPYHTPAYQNGLTHVCCTQYVNPTAQNTAGEIADGYRLLNGDNTVVAPYQASNTVSSGALGTSYADWFAFANGYGLKLCGYEGGWSPDYYPNNYSLFGVITGITRANPCVLTLATTNIAGTIVSGNSAIVGMPICIDQVVGMTQINQTGANVTFTTGSPGIVTWPSAHGFSSGQPLSFSSGRFYTAPLMPGGVTAGLVYYLKTVLSPTTFTISSTAGGAAIAITSQPVDFATISCWPCYVVTSVSGSSVTINLDSSGFSAWTSAGRACYGNPDPGGGSSASANMVNSLRYASKFTNQLQTDTYNNYANFYTAGGEFPSCFMIAGSANVWSVWDMDIYNSTTPPQWAAISAYNNT